MKPTSTRNPNLQTQTLESTRPPTPEKDELVGARPAWWWTGRAPERAIRPQAPLNLAACRRAEMLHYFDSGWTLTEVLFSSLQGDDAFRRPPYHRLRHPLVFYYAHPATFYVNKLRLARLLDAPIHEDFETLFQAGVDEMSWDDLSQAETDWPPVRSVTDYRRAAAY